jgi:MFS family permease
MKKTTQTRASDSADVPAEQVHHNPVYSWYVVFVLMACYALAFVDRQILSLLVDPIKADLGINDTQFGLLQGLAFALFYTFVGLFLANLSDRKNRVKIIAVGIAFWSVMTALCGLSKTYLQLFAARTGVAAGEAALSPAAYSIIGDYFPKQKIGKAMSVYTAGVFLGSGLAFILGGYLMVTLPATMTFPIVGVLKNWQMTFIVVGIPGLLFSLLALTIKEPKRGRYLTSADIQSDDASQTNSISDALRYFRSNLPMFMRHNVGFAMITLIAYAFPAWVPSYFIRTLGWTAAETGIIYGLIALIASPLGVLAGGAMGDWMLKNGYKDAFFRVPVYGAVALMLPACFATMGTNPIIAIVLLVIFHFFSSFHAGMAVASLHLITPVQFRAQATALYLFAINLIGLGLGPVMVALLTDFYFEDPTAVGKSLSMVSVVVIPIAIVLLWQTKRLYNKNYLNSVDN